MNNLDAFQVIILGGGTRSDLRNVPVPKALLPVCNKPVISYQLESILKLGFKRVTILCRKCDKEDFKNCLTEIIQKEADDFVVDVQTKEEYCSTVEAISRVRDKSKDFYFIIGGDVLMKPSFMYSMVDNHRLEKACLSVALQDSKNPTGAPKKGASVDIAGIADGNILTYLASSKNAGDDDIKIRNSLLSKFRNVNFKKVTDAYFYLFSKPAMNLLDKRIEAMNKDGGILSLRKDFIPYILKHQYIKSEGTEQFDFKTILCMIPSTLYLKRINSVKAYFEANRDVSLGKGPEGDVHPKLNPKNFMPSSSKEQLGMSPQQSTQSEEHEQYSVYSLKDCVIGVGTEIENKCKIIGSMLGNHVRIGENTRIINSIIMNHVRIEKDCDIKNTIICNNVLVNAKSSHHDTILTKEE